MKTYWPIGSITGRMGNNHAPAMQNIPRPAIPLSERILRFLSDGDTKTFNQIELGCGAADPINLVDEAISEQFSNRLDKTLRLLIAEGKVVLVARRPTLCFRKGTVLDQIVKQIDGGTE